MEFGNSFSDFDGGFGEIAIDANPYQTELKNAVWILSLVALVIGGIFLFNFHESGVMADKPFVFPLIGAMWIGAIYCVAGKYRSYLNLFPDKNRIVFSSSGIQLPAFALHQFNIFKAGINISPVTLPWMDVEKIYFITKGKSATPYMRILVDKSKWKRSYIDIPKKIFIPQLDALEKYLHDFQPTKFPLAPVSTLQNVENIRRVLKTVPFAVILIAAVIFGMIVSLSSHKPVKENIVYSAAVKQRAMNWATDENPVLTETLTPDKFAEERWPNDALKYREPLKNGVIQGLGIYYFDNGQLYGKIPYRNGQKHGAFTLYREDGTIDQELRYKDGQVHGVQHWTNPEQVWLYINGQAVEKLK